MQQKCRCNKRLIEHRKTIHALKAQLTVYTQAYVNSYKQHVKKNANVILAGKDITEQVFSLPFTEIYSNYSYRMDMEVMCRPSPFIWG